MGDAVSEKRQGISVVQTLAKTLGWNVRTVCGDRGLLIVSRQELLGSSRLYYNGLAAEDVSSLTDPSELSLLCNDLLRLFDDLNVYLIEANNQAVAQYLHPFKSSLFI